MNLSANQESYLKWDWKNGIRVLYILLEEKVLALEFNQTQLSLGVTTSHLCNEPVPGEHSWAPSVCHTLCQLWEWGVEEFKI